MRIIAVFIFIMLAAVPRAWSENYSVTHTTGAFSQNSSMCRLQVTRSGNGTKQGSDVQVSTRPGLFAQVHNSQVIANAVSFLVVTSGMRAKISVDGEAVEVKCTILRNSYDLEIMVSQGPASTPPPNSNAYANGEVAGPSKTLTTSISVMRGQQIELGGIVRDLKAKDQNLSTGGAGMQTASAQGTETVYLKVE